MIMNWISIFLVFTANLQLFKSVDFTPVQKWYHSDIAQVQNYIAFVISILYCCKNCFQTNYFRRILSTKYLIEQNYL